MSATDRRGGLSHRAIFSALAIAVALGVYGGALLYTRFVSFTRVAASHVPATFSAAVRVDVEQVILFEPVRRSLFPLLNELPTPSTKEAPRVRRLESEAGVQLAIDLRELLLGWDNAGNWLGVIAGKFPSQRVAQAVAAEYASSIKQPISPLSLAGAVAAFQLTRELTLAEAVDGALLLGNRKGVELGLLAEGHLLPKEGPGALAISGGEWQRLAQRAVAAAWPKPELAAEFSKLAGLNGKVEIGSEVTLDLELHFRSNAIPDPSVLRAMLESAANTQHLDTLPRAKVSVEQLSAGRARVRISWPKEAMLAYAEQAAQAILAHAKPSSVRP